MSFRMFKAIAQMVAVVIFIYMIKLGITAMLLPALIAVIGLAALERWARLDYERKHDAGKGADAGSTGFYGGSDTNGGWSAGGGASGGWGSGRGSGWGDGWGDGGDGGDGGD